MKIMQIALAAAFAVASTTATAGVVETQAKGKAASASHCHPTDMVVIMPDGVYDVYECHYIGGGWY